jgi:hypothetical protein
VDQLGQDSPGKRCPDCGDFKPLTEFVLNKRRRDGRGTYCRVCFNERSRRHREKRAEDLGVPYRRRREVPAGHKYCPRCAEPKPLEEFGRNRSARDGLTAYCRPCHNTVTRLYLERNGGTRDYHLRRRYGLTAADVEAMIEAQGGRCAVCTQKPEHVDHDHRTKRVRGILCFNCNQALGNVRDYLARNGRGPARPEPTTALVVELYPYRGVPLEVAWRHRAG